MTNSKDNKDKLVWVESAYTSNYRDFTGKGREIVIADRCESYAYVWEIIRIDGDFFIRTITTDGEISMRRIPLEAVKAHLLSFGWTPLAVAYILMHQGLCLTHTVKGQGQLEWIAPEAPYRQGGCTGEQVRRNRSNNAV